MPGGEQEKSRAALEVSLPPPQHAHLCTLHWRRETLRHYRLFAEHIEGLAGQHGLNETCGVDSRPAVVASETRPLPSPERVHLPGAALAEMERLVGSQRLLLGSPLPSPAEAASRPKQSKWTIHSGPFESVPTLAELPSPSITNA